MAKKRIGVLAGIMMLLFSSCIGESRADMLTRQDSAGKAEARLEQILDAIKSKDRDIIKAMFSEYALNEAEDIDGGIDYLFATFPDGIDSWDKIGGSESEHREHSIKTVISSYAFNIYADEDQYVFSIVEQTVNTQQPETVGVYCIVAWKKEDKKPDFNYPTAGIYAPEEFLDN